MAAMEMAIRNQRYGLDEEKKAGDASTAVSSGSSGTRPDLNVRTSYGSLPPTRVASPHGSATSPGSISSPSGRNVLTARSPVSSSIPTTQPTSPNMASAAATANASQSTRPYPPVPSGTTRANLKGPTTANRLAACFRAVAPPSLLWGQSLTTLYAPFNRTPTWLDACLTFLHVHAGDGGAFFARVSESHLESLAHYIEDAGDHAVLAEETLQYYGTAAVAALVKRFLDQLPDPLLTYEKYQQFVLAATASGGSDGSRGYDTGLMGDVRPAAGGSSTLHPPLSRTFPIATIGDGHDQLFIIQSLVVTLPAAHFLLLERLLILLRRFIAAAGETAPRGSEQDAAAAMRQRLGLVFGSSCMAPPVDSKKANTKKAGSGSTTTSGGSALLDGSLQRAQEQQVFLYLLDHFHVIFERNPVRVAEQGLPPPPLKVLDPNEGLKAEANHWRRIAGVVKLNFSRRHFDEKNVIKAFHAWRGMARTNRRRAEAYRQLALLKEELLQERAKSAALAKELHGLQEEYELRDFRDQLRIQSNQIAMTYGTHGITATTVGGIGGSAAARHSTPARPVTMHGSPSRSIYGAEEKEQAAGLGMGIGSSPNRRPSGAPVYTRDISVDLAAVRALQEQDRMLTRNYSTKYNG